ncbi:MAG: fused DSP-PTPase phosphatase/NAD kinase-like protein [Planctomycetota bacterium]
MKATDARRRIPRHRALLWVALAAGLPAAIGGGYYLVQGVWRNNFATVVEQQVYRAAQPTPEELRRWAREYDIRTVVNLRGSGPPSYAAERRAADQAGLALIDIRMTSERPPSRLTVARLVEVLETAQRPMLLHCLRGADRTGVAGVMAAMAVGGRSYDAARSELSWRYFYFGAGIAEFLDAYEQWCRRQGRPTGGWKQFRRWALEHYRHAYYYLTWDVPASLQAAPGERVTATVTFVNRSGRTIPAGDAERQFNLTAFVGTSVADAPEREFGPRTPLPQRGIPPGAAVTVTHDFRAPRRAGTYEVHFDVIEEHVTWFARQGSPVPTCTLQVARASTAPAAERGRRREH